MTMFDTDRHEEEQYSEDSGFKIIGIILTIFFAPSIALAYLMFYILLRRLKMRYHLILLISAILMMITTMLAWNSFSNFELFLDWKNISSNAFTLLGSYLLLCLPFGVIFGAIFTGMKVYQLRKQPELRHIRGWAKGFKYARTPMQIWRKKYYTKSLREGREYDSEKAPLGLLDEEIAIPDSVPQKIKDKVHNKTKESLVYRYYTEAKTHTLITGGTGSGKTITMTSLLSNDVLSGYPLCVIDMKKSPEYIYFLSKWCKEQGRDFYHFVGGRKGEYKNPFGDFQSTYDPLAIGTPTSKADMVLNLRTWDGSAQVFKNRTQDVLQSIFYLLDVTDPLKVPEIEWERGGLIQFVSALDIKNLSKMIEVLNEDGERGLLDEGNLRRLELLIGFHDELTKPKSDLRNQVNELISICRNLVLSSYGDWFTKGHSDKHINLEDIATSDNGPVVLFSFNPQEESEFARYIGSIVLSDLSRVASNKNKAGHKGLFGVYIDEFQTLDPSSVKDNLEKARSAGFYITLSLQSLEQIVVSSSKSGEATRDAIVDTCSNFIFHKGAQHDSGETMAKIIGEARKNIYNSTSKVNNGLFSFNWRPRRALVNSTSEMNWIVPPGEFQALQIPKSSNNYKATAYVINKSTDEPVLAKYLSEQTVARKTHIIVSDEITSGMPEDFSEAIKVTKFDRENRLNARRLAEEKYKDSLNEEYDDWTIEVNDEVDPFTKINGESGNSVDTPKESPPTSSLPFRKLGQMPKLEKVNENPLKDFHKESVKTPETPMKTPETARTPAKPIVNTKKTVKRTSFDDFKKK